MAVLRAACLFLLLLLAIPALLVGGISGAEAIQRVVCRLLLSLIRVRIELQGVSIETPRLVAANHVSWIDILALGSVDSACFLAKSDVASWPVIGTIARMQGAVFVERHRRRSIPAANRALARRLADGRSVLIFPEGTTHDGSTLGRFHTSHLACLRDRMNADAALDRCTVQPVAVRYSDPRAAWIGDATLLPHLWAMLSGPKVRCVLTYGSPIEVARGFDRKALGQTLVAEVAGMLATENSVVQPASVPTNARYRPFSPRGRWWRAAPDEGSR